MTEPETTTSILLIGGERGVREGQRRTLTHCGYQVDFVATGQEGLTKVLTRPFDVVLLDVEMPDISGIEVLKRIHAHNSDTICIITANRITVRSAVQAMKLGAYDVLEKPFSDETLLLAIATSQEKQRQQGQSTRSPQAWDRVWESIEAKATPEQIEEARCASMREVAHELRAPIAAIRSFLTLILQGYSTPAKTREWQQRAAERADDLLGLIDDMLNLARLKDPEYESTREAVFVEAVLKDVLGLHAPEAEAKKIRLTTKTRPSGTILADPMHIKQLWTNLISNAIKYTPKGGQVTVSLLPEGQTIVGMVKDTGIGMSKEDLEHLFKEFFRTEQARAHTPHGTGLGLSIVKQIIQKYGGDISVESQLGKGTQFTFRLPMDT